MFLNFGDYFRCGCGGRFPRTLIIVCRGSAGFKSRKPLKDSPTTQDFVPKRFLNHFIRFSGTFSKIKTKFHTHTLLIFCIYFKNSRHTQLEMHADVHKRKTKQTRKLNLITQRCQECTYRGLLAQASTISYFSYTASVLELLDSTSCRLFHLRNSM